MSSTFSSHAILLYETALARLVLATVFEGSGCLGRPPTRGFVSAVLTGSVSHSVVNVDGHRIGTFGLLAGQRRAAVLSLVDTLLDAGLLVSVRPRLGLVCTAAGRNVLEGHGDLRPLGLLPGAVDPQKLDLAVRSGLVDALRRYRSQEAHRDDVPEFRLFPEATLRNVVASLPTSIEELARVPGLGPRKIEAHGPELLRIVSEHIPTIERLRDERESGYALDDEEHDSVAPARAIT